MNGPARPTVISYTDADAFGGAEICLADICSLTQRHEVVILLHSPEIEAALRRRLERTARIVRIPAPRDKTDARALLSLLQTMLKLRRDGARLLHCHLPTPYRAHFAIIAGRLAGLPVVCTEHSALVSADTALRTRRAVVQNLVSCDIAVSRFVARTLVSELGQRADKVVTIHSGIDRRPFRRDSDGPMRREARVTYGLPPDAWVVGSVGRLDPVKGFGTLLDACRLLHPRARVHAAIAGEGAEHDALEAKAARLGLPLRLPGFVEDVAEFLATLDVFVLSSRSEAFPQALLQAMAAGLPCVANSVGGVKEIISDGETGLLVPPGSGPAGMAAAIQELLDDAGLRTSIGSAARSGVTRRFTREDMAARTEAVYEIFTGGGTRR